MRGRPSAGRSTSSDSTLGLTVRLDERRGVSWTANASNGNAVRSHARASDRELQVCAQCHSRRRQLADGYVAGKPYYDFYRPALLTSPLYHADGQQRDEVYEWGSFLQSRMNAHGVTCSDCHEPHGGKLRAPGAAVCAQCHSSAKYAARAHDHHSAARRPSCLSCHMAAATYMQVDVRRDHSFRVPRPDLTVQLGDTERVLELPCRSWSALGSGADHRVAVGRHFRDRLSAFRVGVRRGLPGRPTHACGSATW